MTTIYNPPYRPTPPPSPLRFLTVSEVARMLRVGKMSIYRLRDSGDLPMVRVGRTLRVSEKALADYVGSAEFTDALVRTRKQRET